MKRFSCDPNQVEDVKFFFDDQQSVPYLSLMQTGKAVEGKVFLKTNMSAEEVLRLDYIENDRRLIVVSSVLLSLLNQYARDDFFVIKVMISCCDGICDEFSAIQIRRLCDCVDKEKSKYNTVPGIPGAVGFLDACFIDEKMKPYNLARDTFYKVIPLVSNELALKLEAHKLNGLYLREVKGGL